MENERVKTVKFDTYPGLPFYVTFHYPFASELVTHSLGLVDKPMSPDQTVTHVPVCSIFAEIE